jgi:hypothetical protein
MQIARTISPQGPAIGNYETAETTQRIIHAEQIVGKAHEVPRRRSRCTVHNMTRLRQGIVCS